MRRSAVLLVTAVLLVGGLAACGSSSKTVTSSDSSSSAAASGAVEDIEISGDFGTKPTVTMPKGFAIGASAARVVIKGSGEAVADGNRLTVEYIVLKGSDGTELNSSFDSGKPAPLTLDRTKNLPVVVDKLIGTLVGSRIVIAAAPADAFGAGGQASAGIGPNETLVFVFDIKELRHPLTVATGTPVDPVAGLPTVTISSEGKPVIAIPAATPPAALVHQPLITGDGATVTSGQTVSVHYTGVVWATGTQFDSSWDSGKPAEFVIGVGRVIAGWDESIVGATVGSRLLLIIPPDKGYGASGNTQAGISGTDTLVFVVDILDAG